MSYYLVGQIFSASIRKEETVNAKTGKVYSPRVTVDVVTKYTDSEGEHSDIIHCSFDVLEPTRLLLSSVGKTVAVPFRKMGEKVFQVMNNEYKLFDVHPFENQYDDFLKSKKEAK
jgi:hypothetical protein